MNIKVFTLNSFSKNSTGGNPAGVVMNADSLSDEQMQDIARKVGLSETAFVSKSEVAYFKVRFFTQNDEVDLCGHATIATFYLMFNQGIIDVGFYTQETKAGILNIEVMKNGIIFMNQKRPEFFEIIDQAKIIDSLNLSSDDLDLSLPIQVVSTGLRDVMIPIKNMKVLDSIKPDLEKISRVSEKYNLIGYHLFTFDTFDNATAYCRNFAPLYDIDEESATGTSNGALASYLYKYKKMTKEEAKNLKFEQGFFMGKPSEIFVKLEIDENQIIEVRVGGKASNINKNIINIDL